MNSIRQIQALNQRELDSAVSPEASWHADYRDTAYIYIGGLPFDLSEGDILTIFSQFGEPVHLNLVRDKETGKSKGFAFLKYEDQRSTDLAVDNLGGATVMERLLRVDHTRYKRREEEGLEDNLARLDGEDDETRKRDTSRRSKKAGSADESDGEKQIKAHPLLKEEKELERIMEEHDEEDPMKEYLVSEKKAEIERARKKAKSSGHEEASEERGERRRHRPHHHHRHRRPDEDHSDSHDRRSSRRESRPRSRERRRHREKRDRSK